MVKEAAGPDVTGSGGKPSSKGRKPSGFTEEERSAMKERIKEMKAEGEDGEKLVLAKIAEMEGTDRPLGARLHAIVKASAPALTPRLWYGMPAYAGADGKIICHFQPASKFKTRYATIGFSDRARLDEGSSWPVAFALKELTKADEARIAALVKKAAGLG